MDQQRWISKDVGSPHCPRSLKQKVPAILWTWELRGGLGVEKYWVLTQSEEVSPRLLSPLIRWSWQRCLRKVWIKRPLNWDARARNADMHKSMAWVLDYRSPPRLWCIGFAQVWCGKGSFSPGLPGKDFAIAYGPAWMHLLQSVSQTRSSPNTQGARTDGRIPCV